MLLPNNSKSIPTHWQHVHSPCRAYTRFFANKSAISGQKGPRGAKASRIPTLSDNQVGHYHVHLAPILYVFLPLSSEAYPIVNTRGSRKLPSCHDMAGDRMAQECFRRFRSTICTAWTLETTQTHQQLVSPTPEHLPCLHITSVKFASLGMPYISTF